MSRPGRRRFAGSANLSALVLPVLALCALAFAAPASAQLADDAKAADPSAHAYVDGFCLPIAGGYVDDDYAKFLGDWHARSGASNEALQARPQDAQAPGQFVRLPEAGAPAAIVDPRRDVCSLIWPQAILPASALVELARDQPPVGLKGAPTPWRRVSPAPRVGPARNPRFILLVGGAPDRGVCAERLDDLRRHDGGVISMLQLAPCRLAAGETVIDGPG